MIPAPETWPGLGEARLLSLGQAAHYYKGTPQFGEAFTFMPSLTDGSILMSGPWTFGSNPAPGFFKSRWSFRFIESLCLTWASSKSAASSREPSRSRSPVRDRSRVIALSQGQPLYPLDSQGASATCLNWRRRCACRQQTCTYGEESQRYLHGETSLIEVGRTTTPAPVEHRRGRAQTAEGEETE
jgi:hypothetical protein